MNYRNGQLAALDYDFRACAHAGQNRSKVPGGFRFGDANHIVSHAAIILSLLGPPEPVLVDLCAQFSHFVQHALAQDVIGSGLISLAGFLQPSHHIGIQTQGHRLFDGR